jgi:hypothetical protein
MGKGLGDRRITFFPYLNVIAAASFADRSHNHSLTVSSVCQGGCPVEDSYIKQLQIFEYKELNGGRDWD